MKCTLNSAGTSSLRAPRISSSSHVPCAVRLIPATARQPYRFFRVQPRIGFAQASRSRRFMDNGGMFGGDLEQRAGRAAGLDGSALPFADGAK